MAAIITPNSVQRDGGYKISLTGLSSEGVSDGTYFFHVGASGNFTDPKAYAGSYGNESTVTVAGGSGSFVTPPMQEPGNYTITAYTTSAPSGVGVSLGGTLGYYNKVHRGSTFTFRTIQPTWGNTGPRDIEGEPSQ